MQLTQANNAERVAYPPTSKGIDYLESCSANRNGLYVSAARDRELCTAICLGLVIASNRAIIEIENAIASIGPEDRDKAVAVPFPRA